MYQATPSWSEFTSGRTVAYRSYRYLQDTPGEKIASDVIHQVHTRPYEAGLQARDNAERAGAGWWTARWRAAAVATGTFFGMRDIYEGHYGIDILSGQELDTAEQSGRFLGGWTKLICVASAPAAAQASFARSMAAVRKMTARVAQASQRVTAGHLQMS